MYKKHQLNITLRLNINVNEKKKKKLNYFVISSFDKR